VFLGQRGFLLGGAFLAGPFVMAGYRPWIDNVSRPAAMFIFDLEIIILKTGCFKSHEPYHLVEATFSAGCFIHQMNK
jgi:hypothetical protein